MLGISIDEATRQLLESMYWKEGRTLDFIAHKLEKSRATVQELFRKADIPTKVTLIRDFQHYQEVSDIDPYLRSYMTLWNRMSYDSSANKVSWRVVSENKRSLRALQKHLKNVAYVDAGIYPFRQESNVLSVAGLRKCGYLSNYFDLDWDSEITKIQKDSPWKGRKLASGEAMDLVRSFVNRDWQPAAWIAELAGYDVKYTSKMLRQLTDQGYLERDALAGRVAVYRRAHRQ
jgi:hypothetical protein